MDLSFLDNIVLSHKENKYIKKEQDRLRKQIEEYNKPMQASIPITNLVYYGMIRSNEPERDNNKWKIVNGIWLLSDEIKLTDVEVSIYKNLFDQMGIKYSVREPGGIYYFNYQLTIDEYNEIRKYFEEKMNIPDEMVLPSLIAKGVINKENNGLLISQNYLSILIEYLEQEAEKDKPVWYGDGNYHQTSIYDGELTLLNKIKDLQEKAFGMTPDECYESYQKSQENQPKKLVKKPKKDNKGNN